MTTATDTPDVITDNYGSIVGITPMTPAAREWIDENVSAEPWQWLGATLNIDRRYAGCLIDGMIDAGLTVQSHVLRWHRLP